MKSERVGVTKDNLILGNAFELISLFDFSIKASD